MTKRNQFRKEAVDLTVGAKPENRPKLLKKQKLRNNEYYDMQDVFDKLHAEAVTGKSFNDLMAIISCENNILLAYRNIKSNRGSKTKGTDGHTIECYKGWDEARIVKYFQEKLANYYPKSVRRVEIPKEGQPDKKRPLGIPCMDDRIIQQCIRQVLEPICEAKFHNHSYGFRPNRSTDHAIARASFLMWANQLHYVVDIDIKGFFDNVNHGKLLKQMWGLGIQDKNLLSIIGRILKSKIQGVGIPNKGTPQGGIISPLLSNIMLNELDWWLSNQWETKHTRHDYVENYSRHRALRTSNLKEFFFVRYADDFKIFCRDYKVAQKIFIATRQWLKDRLGLEISPEKSNITNVRKGKTEFLGFALFVERKKGKFITRSNISEKAKQAMQSKLKGQIKAIQKNKTPEQVNKLNSMILGMHNYYNTATLCALDFREINFIVSKCLHNRLKSKPKKVKGKSKKPETELKKSKTYQKFYGQYDGKPNVVAGVTIFPIYGCTFKVPLKFTQEINDYTPSGRQLRHSRLKCAVHLVRYLLDSKEYDKSVEYNDNRISLMAGQRGKCGVTGEPLTISNMVCHHKKPKDKGGSDEYDNLMWMRTDVHKLIHATQPDTIEKYLKILNLDEKALKKVNSLRLSAENLEIIAPTVTGGGST
jgi:group II intron reverse transcriptase/maturase